MITSQTRRSSRFSPFAPFRIYLCHTRFVYLVSIYLLSNLNQTPPRVSTLTSSTATSPARSAFEKEFFLDTVSGRSEKKGESGGRGKKIAEKDSGGLVGRSMRMGGLSGKKGEWCGVANLCIGTTVSR